MIAALVLVLTLAQPALVPPVTETSLPPRIQHEDPFPTLPFLTTTTTTPVVRKRLAQTGSDGGVAPVAGALLAAGGLAVMLGRSRDP